MVRMKISVLVSFQINPDMIGNVLLWDAHNTSIPRELFSLIILQYMHCNCFSIKIGLKSDPNEPILVEVSVLVSHIFFS